ncbi:hypothetical protein LK994_05360 [Ferruginibacter lapsinanis]|uniref:hypothetical protein n=1 Tax=Ferruginibacter lapsinanis TaxID=563172 RepID=UPI001E3B50BB|nr:hypothetical protein [Ferruginibacter lapsinanis]UEG50900.1 hypothetical protein LK994_05360 [Ferruginibacter lapsinanis]
MKTKLIIAAIAFLSISTTSANAQKMKNQHHRIAQGVRSGELTKVEAKKLRTDQKEIHQEVKVAKADGVVTPAERKEIRKDQRQANRKIYRKKHNDRVRG